MRTMTTQAPVTRYTPKQAFWRRVLNMLVQIDTTYRQRRAFEQLDAHLLRDIGLRDTDPSKRSWQPPVQMRHY